MDITQPLHAGTFEQLLEAMPDGIFVVGMEGGVVRANQRAEALSGYSRDELLGMAIEQLVPEAQRPAHAGHRKAYLRHPAVRSMGAHLDIRFRRRDGSEFPADIALSPVVTDQGVLIVAAVRDITERQRAAEELLHAQERFRLVVEAVSDYAIFMLDPEGRVSSWSPGAERLKGYTADEIVGRDFSVFYTSPDIAAGKPARILALAARAGRHEEEGWRVRKDGSRFWANVILTAIRDPTGPLLGYAKVTRDVTERKLQDDRLRAVLEVAQATLEGRPEAQLLQLIAQRARALTQSALGLVILDADLTSETVTVAAADGPRAAAIAGREFPLAGSVAEPEGPLMEAAGAGPSVSMRLASGQRSIGSLLVINEPGGARFSDRERELLELFAAQAAVAIDYTRARDELQRLAVLEDRERIGRELHDGAIQALFAVGMSLQGMAMMASDAGLRERLEAAVGQVDEVIRDLRNYIFGLRPGLAADRQLGRALRELGEQLERQHGVACAIEIEPAAAARLANRAADIVQVAREALANVARHSGAATCRISLREEAGFETLTVEDDGNGFVPGKATEGWGLRNLGERAAAMGGTLDVVSVPGEGTTVSLRLPV